MTKLKKLLALALAGVLALCVLTGCGGSSDTGEAGSMNSPEVQQILDLLNTDRTGSQLVNTYGYLAEQVLNSFSTTKEEAKPGTYYYASVGGDWIPDGYTTIGANTEYMGFWSIEEDMDYDDWMQSRSDYMKECGARALNTNVGIATRTINGRLYFVAIVEAGAYV